MNAASIFLSDGKFYTSAGITAGIDLSLALIEEDCGRPLESQGRREVQQSAVHSRKAASSQFGNIRRIRAGGATACPGLPALE